MLRSLKHTFDHTIQSIQLKSQTILHNDECVYCQEFRRHLPQLHDRLEIKKESAQLKRYAWFCHELPLLNVNFSVKNCSIDEENLNNLIKHMFTNDTLIITSSNTDWLPYLESEKFIWLWILAENSTIKKVDPNINYLIIESNQIQKIIELFQTCRGRVNIEKLMSFGKVHCNFKYHPNKTFFSF